MKSEIRLFFDSLLFSYSSIFFTQNKWFGSVLCCITMLYPLQGICGLFCCMLVNAISLSLSLNREKIRSGLYGFNAIMIGLALGAIYPYSETLVVLIFALSLLVLMLTVAMEGFFKKYNLPFLAFPFLACLWIVLLLSQQLDAGVSTDVLLFTSPQYLTMGEFSVYTLIEKLNNVEMPICFDLFLKSIGVLFFQSDRLTGLLISIALFCVSRLSFCYALGFFLSGYFCYNFLGAELFHIPYLFFGFNFIFTAIAVGCCYLVPSFFSILGLFLLLPSLFIVVFSSTRFLSYLFLPSFSLSFCLVSILYLYVLRLRENSNSLRFPFIIENTPEENFYYDNVNNKRFKYLSYFPFSLPFLGEWTVKQGYNGEYTHKDEWRYAWDFVVEVDNMQFKGNGERVEDYYCYEKPVLAPAAAIVISVCNGIEDNLVGQVNKENNWGNYIILKHFEGCFSVLAHLKIDSIKCAPGDVISHGQELALCGNSGYSPYPHLHFQFQKLPYIGAPTQNYPFTYYLSKTNNLEWVASGVPKLDEVVTNLSVSNFNVANYLFCEGNKIDVNSTRFGAESWSVHSYLGGYYLQSGNGAKAWFVNDSKSFYFQRFVGNKKCALYYFYLSNFRVLKSTGQNWSVKEQFPASNCNMGCLNWLQDILAPFVTFIKFNYNSVLPDMHLHSENLAFYSSFKKEIFGRLVEQLNFETIWTTANNIRLNIKERNDEWFIKINL